jgi:hypothetical protein
MYHARKAAQPIGCFRLSPGNVRQTVEGLNHYRKRNTASAKHKNVTSRRSLGPARRDQRPMKHSHFTRWLVSSSDLKRRWGSHARLPDQPFGDGDMVFSSSCEANLTYAHEDPEHCSSYVSPSSRTCFRSSAGNRNIVSFSRAIFTTLGSRVSVLQFEQIPHPYSSAPPVETIQRHATLARQHSPHIPYHNRNREPHIEHSSIT